jgi:hypothetical protein
MYRQVCDGIFTLKRLDEARPRSRLRGIYIPYEAWSPPRAPHAICSAPQDKAAMLGRLSASRPAASPLATPSSVQVGGSGHQGSTIVFGSISRCVQCGVATNRANTPADAPGALRQLPAGASIALPCCCAANWRPRCPATTCVSV